GMFLGETLAAIQCDPIHDVRIHKMILLVSHLPNTCIRTLPILADPIEATTDLDPHIVRNRADIFVVEVERIHQLTVNIRLELRDGGIADANWSRFAI